MTNTETTDATDRVARFKSDVAEMRLSDPRASRDRMWGIVGGILMVLGIALTVVAYFQSHDADFAFNSSGPATQRDALIIALIGVTVAIVGAALFLRYTLAQFLRFWLARLIYEQQAQTDRVVDATQSR
jgi:uncharacterized membrane protein YidH (DUF202 family)